MAENPTKPKPLVVTNSWSRLRRLTDARIGLGRAGISQPTQVQLQFQLDHAKARDAIHIPLDAEQLSLVLKQQGLENIICHSQARDRTEYLQRPDLGRRLGPESSEQLKKCYAKTGNQQASIVIVDGLSSTAVQHHATSLTRTLVNALRKEQLSISPICIVQQGRVAIGDEIGELLHSELLILLVGERPGLSSPDSLGIYYTYAPRKGLNDAHRNCLSNIRPAGMSEEDATKKLMWLIRESRRRGLSGVALKDESMTGTALDSPPNTLPDLSKNQA